ncbi:cobalamin B12-binding domain-containing protein [Caminicella sporogenes]|uniref:cobalamin B12-binding domain-containing protein n=1 Tax=Caminicella sporogenes TaxID=166485 RepID=UPI0025415688|nr:cobalamin B12-binding domain-containing protein [Caminicella sporogenes]WIF95698.1 cobalamin B12-binding domain-containing protein [Caminicella sporogenes]
MRGKIIACSIGNCVHVAGVVNFLRLAEEMGYESVFLGPAVSIEKLIEKVKKERPKFVGVSYRLTPSALYPLLEELKKGIEREGFKDIKWLFGGTEPTAEVARKANIFYKVFDIEGMDKVINFLKGKAELELKKSYGRNLIERIEGKYPYPVLRHHFGLPSLEETIRGIEEIAESEVLDIISLAPDQNAQQYFFRQEKMDNKLDGAGGVPVRCEKDFINIYKAAQRGNYPLIRCYSGTSDLLKMAELIRKTLKNAWCAVPLCWYNELDGRGDRKLLDSIRENQKVMKWHGERNIPVEVNESHHWSLRDAHDTLGVVMAFLAAYNAKKAGVKTYIAQYMFNVPPAISPKMDLAKMLAKIELIESLEDDNFKTLRQARAGLAKFSPDLNLAKGQLAASAGLAMAIKPHIYHVVGYCEAHHAATPKEVIESCKIVRGVIEGYISGYPNIISDEEVISRKNWLIKEAKYTLEFIKENFKEYRDPWSSPEVIAKCIKLGILDAPHLKGNPAACGKLETRIVNGRLEAYDMETGKVLSEEERLDKIWNYAEKVSA